MGNKKKTDNIIFKSSKVVSVVSLLLFKTNFRICTGDFELITKTEKFKVFQIPNPTSQDYKLRLTVRKVL